MSFCAKNANTTTMRIGNAALLKNLLMGVVSGLTGWPSLPSVGRFSGRFPSGVQRRHERQVPVALREIEAVADREAVRDLEADVPGDDLHLATLRFREQSADL